MKLNSVSQLSTLTDKKITEIHPYSPKIFEGYGIKEKTGDQLKEITGMWYKFSNKCRIRGNMVVLMIKKYHQKR